jgi:hypothetical protein
MTDNLREKVFCIGLIIGVTVMIGQVRRNVLLDAPALLSGTDAASQNYK